ncbi:MAG: YbaB/EbfC family nucleoid-associated protein [Candidatus Fermentibacteria bacterium]
MNQKQLQKMMAQAQKMQAGVVKVQEELADARVPGESAAGLVKAVVTGQGELVELSISPEAVDPDDIEILEDIILVAVSNAVPASRNLSEDKMQVLGIPGLGGLL